MNLRIKDVVKLYDQARALPLNYMQACPEYGVARWVIAGWDMEIRHKRLVAWGPLERWGVRWADTLPYERIEIIHADFLVELEAHHGALVYHSQLTHNRSKSSRYYENCYTLDWCGDLSVMQEVFVYHSLVM